MRNISPPRNARRSVRLRGYDYRQAGVYFVTVCTHRKIKAFGSISEGEMITNDLGCVVSNEWRHIAEARANVQLDLYVVMPNHLHGIIIIDDRLERDSYRFDKAFNRNQSGTLQAGSLGAIVGHFKAAVSRRAKRANVGCQRKIWQRSYYEHIIRNEKSLNEIRRYIIDNPERWSEDTLYVE